MWFESRLKPIKERLRGIEAKGVDIVSFWFHEDVTAAWRPNEWVRRMNTFEYDLELSRPCRHRFTPANQDPILNGFRTENTAASTTAASSFIGSLFLPTTLIPRRRAIHVFIASPAAPEPVVAA
jgi:hypothetical protein